MVKMNGCAAIDSARPFRFLADKAAVAADFHLRKWRLLTWETENSKHSKCSYTCENQRGTTEISLQNSKQIRWVPTPELAILASNARVYTPVQSCWGNAPNPWTISEKSVTLLRSWFCFFKSSTYPPLSISTFDIRILQFFKCRCFY